MSVCDSRGQREFDDLQKIQDVDERLNAFSSYPVDRQIDIYLFSQKIPAFLEGETYLRFMAHQGDQKVLEIARRIDSEEDLTFKRDLIGVLDVIDMKCECVHNNREVMKILAQNDLDVTDTDPPDVISFKGSYRITLDRIKSRRPVR